MSADWPSSLLDNRHENSRPFMSICIPQYNRTDYLILACKSFARQNFRDFEVCISDDCSDDGKNPALLEYLEGSGLSYVYRITKTNLRYDGNLRNAIALSRGRYLLLMGNDDGLVDENVLQSMHDALLRHAPVEVAITNYLQLPTGHPVRRMTSDIILGQGIDVAISTFRRYSFVSGVIFDGDLSRKEATNVCDGSEMYQMYLGTRIVASGGRFLSLDKAWINKDLQIAGQTPDSYQSRPRISPCEIKERPLPMGRLLEIVTRGLEPHVGFSKDDVTVRICKQLYGFIYPYWIVEYRRIQSWRYAFGIVLALRPPRIVKDVALSPFTRARLWMMYFTMAVAGLAIPLPLFNLLRPFFFSLAKRTPNLS